MSDADDEEISSNSPINFEASPSSRDSATPCNFRASPPSAQMRKDFYLHQRIATLRHRNEDIQLKVRATKMDRESETQIAKETFVSHLKNATERRLMHLQTIRLKAKVLGSHSDESSFLHPRLEQLTGPTNALYLQGIPSRKKTFNEAVKVAATAKLYHVKTIQRAIRGRLLLDRVSRVKNSNIFYNVLNGYYTFSHAVELVKSSQMDDISLLFKSLYLPPPAISTDPYVWAFCAIPLLCDFGECSKGNIITELAPEKNDQAPAVYTSAQNSFSSQFLVILHQISLRLFQSILCLLEAPRSILLCPISLLRLRIARYWRLYHFFLVLMKKYNLIQQQETTGQSINSWLLQFQDNKSEIYKRMKFQSCFLALNWHNSHQEISLGDTVFPWAQTDTDLRTLSETIFRAGTMMATFRYGTRSYYLDYDANDFLMDNHFHKFVVVEKGTHYFTVPPDVCISKWRKFWYLKFEQRIKKWTGHPGPEVMKSGTRQNLPLKDVPFSWNEIIELRDTSSSFPHSFASSSWVDDLSALDLKLTATFYRFCDYCFQIGEDEETTECIMNLRELQSAYMAKQLGPVNPVMAAVYFRLFLILLAQVVLLAGGDSSNIEEVLGAEKLDYRDFSLQLFNLYHDCETQLFVKWFYYCKPNTYRDFVISENIYQLVLECYSKEDPGSSSPQLRFPEFYRYLLLNPSFRLTDRIDPLLIITTSLWGPLFESENPQKKVKEFYLSTLMVFVITDMGRLVQDKWKMNRIDQIGIFAHFAPRLWELCKRARSLVWASCISSMLQLNPVQAQIVYSHFEKDSSLSILQSHVKAAGATEFQLKYLTHILTSTNEQEVISLFTKKLLDAFHDSKSCKAVVMKNSPYFAERVLRLRKDIIEVNTGFYNLYFPLLNWIHFDLGSPELRKGNLD